MFLYIELEGINIEYARHKVTLQVPTQSYFPHHIKNQLM